MRPGLAFVLLATSPAGVQVYAAFARVHRLARIGVRQETSSRASLQTTILAIKE